MSDQGLSLESKGYYRGHAEAQDELAALRKERDELRKALTDALGPVAAWAGTYAGQREMPNIHPQHQELIDRIKALATPDVGE